MTESLSSSARRRLAGSDSEAKLLSHNGLHIEVV
jgi:hypothetical protein